MFATIVQSRGPVCLVGAGDVGEADLDLVRRYGTRVVAADGGAAWLVNHGIRPDAVIGDMDSAAPEVLAAIPPARVHRIDEQDTTDFDKCLRSVAAPLVLALGFAGPRLDHTLAVYNALVRHHARRVLVVGARDVVFHVPGEIAVALPVGTRLSLFPMAAIRGRSEGLRWPIEGIEFAPAGRIGTSNEVTGPVRLEVEGPGMLAITPREALAPVAAALGG